MLLETVIDRETGAKYRIEKEPLPGGGERFARLGIGAFGDVFRFELIEGYGAEKAAVKELLPQNRPGTEAYQDFGGELDVIKTIEKALPGKKGCARVPWAHRGYDPLDENRTILILEYVPLEWRLIDQLRDGRLPEELGLETMAQYAGLLDALHHSLPDENSGYSLHGDRKSSDFYWSQEGERRLIVLNWNQARRLPNNDDAHAFMRQDLHGMGQIWSEFMLGESRMLIPDPLDDTDEKWSDLSLGVRQLLKLATSSQPLTAAELQTKAEIFLDELKRAKQDPGGLLSEIEALDLNGQWERILILTDLIFHLENADQVQKEHAITLYRRAQKQLENDQDKIRGKLLGLFADMESAVGTGDFDAVDRLLFDARQLAGENVTLQTEVEQIAAGMAEFRQARVNALLGQVQALFDDSDRFDEIKVTSILEEIASLDSQNKRAAEFKEKLAHYSLNKTRGEERAVPDPIHEQLRLIKKELESSLPDLVEIGRRLDTIEKSAQDVDDRIDYEKVREIYQGQLKTAISRLEGEIKQSKAQMEKVLEQDDPKVYLGLKEDPVFQMEKAVNEIDALSNSAHEKLGEYRGDLLELTPKMEQIRILADYYQKIHDIWKLAQFDEEERSGSGFMIMEKYKSAQNLALEAEKDMRLTRPYVRSHVGGLVNEAERLYREANERHFIPSSLITASTIFDLILDWQRGIEVNPEEKKRIVSYYTSWAEMDKERILPQPLEDALGIARLRLQRKVWREMVEDYLASARRDLIAPEKTPGSAKGWLDRIKRMPGLNDSDLDLDLDPETKSLIEKFQEPIDKALRTREKILIDCERVKKESAIDLKTAWQCLREAEQAGEEERQIRQEWERQQRRDEQKQVYTEEEKVASKGDEWILPKLQIPELVTARLELEKKTVEEFRTSLCRAEDRLASGLWQSARTQLHMANSLGRFVTSTVQKEEEERLEATGKALDAVEEAQKRIQLAGEDITMIRSVLEGLFAFFQEQGGQKYVSAWSDFGKMWAKVQAYSNAEELVRRMEAIAEHGDTQERLQNTLCECDEALKTIAPTHSSRLQKAKVGVQSWLAIRRAEQQADRFPQRALKSLQSALDCDYTRQVATNIKNQINNRMISDRQAQNDMEELEALIRVNLKIAYKKAKSLSELPTHFQDTFEDKLASIRIAWEQAVTREIDQLLRESPDNYIKLRENLDNLQTMDSIRLAEYEKKVELPAAEAEAKFKEEMLNIVGPSQPGKRDSGKDDQGTWKDLEEAYQQAFQIAVKYGDLEKATFWQRKKAEASKKQVLYGLARQKMERFDDEALKECLMQLNNLNEKLNGRDAEVWLELGRVHLELGKRERRWN